MHLTYICGQSMDWQVLFVFGHLVSCLLTDSTISFSRRYFHVYVHGSSMYVPCTTLETHYFMSSCTQCMPVVWCCNMWATTHGELVNSQSLVRDASGCAASYGSNWMEDTQANRRQCQLAMSHTQPSVHRTIHEISCDDLNPRPLHCHSLVVPHIFALPHDLHAAAAPQ